MPSLLPSLPVGKRPDELPELTAIRLREIKDLLTHESSISFTSARAHESMWLLVAEAEESLSRPYCMEHLVSGEHFAEGIGVAHCQLRVGHHGRHMDLDDILLERRNREKRS